MILESSRLWHCLVRRFDGRVGVARAHLAFIVIVIVWLVVIRKVVVGMMIVQWQIQQLVRGGFLCGSDGTQAAIFLTPHAVCLKVVFLHFDHRNASLEVFRCHILCQFRNGGFQLGNLGFHQGVFALQLPRFFLADGLNEIGGSGIGNITCLCSIPQGIDGFFDVEISWADAGDHDRSGIATKRILQQTGQFRIAIGRFSRWEDLSFSRVVILFLFFYLFEYPPTF
mmetsp:Transcript_31052/g.73172  ORF Transcript_31052/g.73172 Transcript_31052/m.73172 type:complete len:226 (+) Transcript_31052:1422-2099(+)